MNGKLFVLPTSDGGNFKELLTRLASAGAGRPVDEDGFPSGPWTPDLLAEAISQIDANPHGIDLRTVQLWFQDNERGISPDNIRWLARIFGCGDTEATSEWQRELSAAQSRLTAKRREKRKRAESSDEPSGINLTVTAIPDHHTESSADMAHNSSATTPQLGSGLSMKSEAIFSRRSPLDLPASVFAGAVALGFMSYLVNIHSVTYGPLDGIGKQVGFLWAPNWTFLFMVFMPLYLAFVVELLTFWKDEGRQSLVVEGGQMESDGGWARSVEASKYTYWAVFLICLPIAGLFQWVGRRLIPLMKGDLGTQAEDWGVLAIVRPEVISLPEAIGFTGLAYLYMSVCFYLFFVGLILLYTITHDFRKIWGTSQPRTSVDSQYEFGEVGLKVICGIFRCTVLGLLIAISMKLQSAFLVSTGDTILEWMLSDLLSVIFAPDELSDAIYYSTPTHYSSLIIALATCFVFFCGSLRIPAVWKTHGDGIGNRFQVLWGKMVAVVALLVAGYLLIGVFAGFSILLSGGVLLAIYSLVDPRFGRGRADALGGNQNVS